LPGANRKLRAHSRKTIAIRSAMARKGAVASTTTFIAIRLSPKAMLTISTFARSTGPRCGSAMTEGALGPVAIQFRSSRKWRFSVTRSAAYLMYVSTGSAGNRHLQADMGLNGGWA
jgi:hypothetical protein